MCHYVSGPYTPTGEVGALTVPALTECMSLAISLHAEAASHQACLLPLAPVGQPQVQGFHAVHPLPAGTTEENQCDLGGHQRIRTGMVALQHLQAKVPGPVIQAVAAGTVV